MRKFTIRDDIYGTIITLVVSSVDEYNALIASVCSNASGTDVGASAQYQVIVYVDGTRQRFIWLPDWVSDIDHLKRLVHECDHARHEILKSAGLKRDKGSEEAYTYFNSWLFGECLKCLNRKMRR